MIRRIFINKFFVVVCFLALIISFLASGHWFFDDKILYFWDSYVPFDPKISFNQLFYFWQDRLFPGSATPGLSWLIYWGLFFLPYLFTSSLSISQAFVYIVLLTFSLINFYLLSEQILKTVLKEKDEPIIKITSLALAFLYTYNVFTFFNFYFMFNPGAFIITFLPLNFLALFKIYPIGTSISIKRKNIWTTVFVVSLVFMSPGFSVYVFFLQYLVWIAIYLFLYWFISKKGLFSRLTAELLIFYLFIFTINLWWFYPAFLNIVGSYTAQSQFGTTMWFDEGFKDVQLLNVFRGIGSALMTNNKFSWTHFYSNNFFALPLFLFPALFVASLIFLKRKITAIFTFLLCIVLVSLFIVKFSNPPFAWILGYFFHYIPFFGGFRDSVQKAGVYFQLGFMLFAAVGASFIISSLVEKRSKILLLLFLSVFIIASLVLTGPFFLFAKDNSRIERFTFNKKNYSINARTKVPPEYLSLKNFFESKCQGETVLEIPRSGFVTNAIWDKYDLSYAGQDILPAMIDCNFLTTATFSSKAEFSIQVPYLFLEQEKFDQFKAYLTQHNIKYVLVRNDFIPQPLVTWTYVEPQKAKNSLEEDDDFRKIYSNAIFSIFEKKGIPEKSYGFGLSRNVTASSSLIENGQDYMALSEALGNLSNPVILDSEISQNLFRSQSNITAASANCIGCLKVGEKALVVESGPRFIKPIKSFIKSIFRKPLPLSDEKKISLRLIQANDKFINITRTIETRNEKNFLTLAEEYKKEWSGIYSDISTFDSDRFSKNNKLIEAGNFITAQKNTSLNYLYTQVFLKNKFLNTTKMRESMESLILFQTKIAENLSKKTVSTDFEKNVYWARVDVPKDGEYKCLLTQRFDSADIKSVRMEDKLLNEREFNGADSLRMKKGSFLLNIAYAPKENFRQDKVTVRTKDYYPIKIGRLDQDKYVLKFKVPPQLRGRALIAITKGEISKEELSKIESTVKSNIDVRVMDSVNLSYMQSLKIYADIFDVNYEYSTEIRRTFDVDAPEVGEYFLYLYIPDPEVETTEISDLSVQTNINDAYFRFVCLEAEIIKMDKSAISVKKHSPTHFSLTLPKNYKGFLTFNRTYDRNWVAYAEGSSEELPHIENGYANAWYIENPQDKKIVVKYSSQDKVENVIVLSMGALIFLFWFYLRIRR